ncbi:MAG: hypothetical protein MO852_17245, partial [Candidatus Devosia euplotis]|nr:hypothetical protein [Candidatus Devosia euplotis]
MQQFTVPCGSTASSQPFWHDEDSEIRFQAPQGDKCEGRVSAIVSLRDIAGTVPFDPQSFEYDVDTTGPAPVAFSLPRLEGERRYVGTMLLTNEAEKTSEVELDFVTGCGAIEPRVVIIDGTYLGSVEASDCQFPIGMQIEAVHSSGDIVQTVNAVLKGRDFELVLPDFENWPAGDYDIATQFIGMTGRARANNELTINCVSPALSEPAIEVSPSGTQADVVFDLSDRDRCQGQTQVSLQVRDANGVVVFNCTEDVAQSSVATSFRWPFDGVPGNRYSLDVSASFGLNNTEQVGESAQVLHECQMPTILNTGHTNAEATHVGAVVAMTACNA